MGIPQASSRTTPRLPCRAGRVSRIFSAPRQALQNFDPAEAADRFASAGGKAEILLGTQILLGWFLDSLETIHPLVQHPPSPLATPTSRPTRLERQAAGSQHPSRRRGASPIARPTLTFPSAPRRIPAVPNRDPVKLRRRFRFALPLTLLAQASLLSVPSAHRLSRPATPSPAWAPTPAPRSASSTAGARRAPGTRTPPTRGSGPR